MSPSSRTAQWVCLLVVTAGLLWGPAAVVQAGDWVWEGGTGNWSDSLLWDPNGVPNAADANVYIDGGLAGTDSIVSLNMSTTIGSLWVDAGDELRLLNSYTLTLGDPCGGLISNDGLITLNSAGSWAQIQIFGDTLLTGSGVVDMSNWTTNAILGSAGTRLTNDVSHTIRGSGHVGWLGTMALTNLGLIEADQAVALDINPGTGPDGVINQGTMRAVSGGVLRLTGGAINNAGGVIEAANSSIVRLLPDADVTGGVLQTDGTGYVTSGAASAGAAATYPVLADLTTTGRVTVPSSYALAISGTITNDGTIELSSVGGWTYLHTWGDPTLSGSGELVMSNAAWNVIWGDGGRLTNDADHTLRGAGQLCDNTITLTNLGTIEADQANALTIDPVNAKGTEVINQGTMRATAGGTLTLSDGQFHNTGGVIEAADGSVVRLTNNADVTGGAVQTAGTGYVTTGTGYSAAPGLYPVLADLTTTGRVTVPSGNALAISGAITNNGAIELNSVGNWTYLHTRGDVTLTGSGEVVLSNASWNYIWGDGGRLTNDADHTIRGAGKLGGNTITLTNLGTIEADQATALVIDPLNAKGNEVINTGTMRATGGGRLALADGEFDNTGGVIEADTNTAIVYLNLDADITGGTIQTSNDGQIRANQSAVAAAASYPTLSDLTSTGLIVVPNQYAVAISGQIVNDGTIALNSTNTYTYLYSRGDVTLAGSGEVTMSNHSQNYVWGDGGRLTNDAGHAIRGAGQLCYNYITLTNLGLVEGTQPNYALTIDPVDAPNSNVINQGTMRAAGGGTLELTGGTFDNTGGLIEAEANSVVLLSNNAVVTGGVLDTTDNGSIRSNVGYNSIFRPTIHDLTIAGVVDVPNAKGLRISGAVTNNGTLSLSSTNTWAELRLVGDTVLDGLGEVRMSPSSMNAIYGPAGTRLTNEAGHTITGAGLVGVDLLAIVNRGVIQADQPGEALVVDPNNGDPVMNTGTMRATGTGKLTLQGGLFDNTGGVIEADTNSFVLLDAGAVVTGGTLQGGGAILSGEVDTSGNRPLLRDLTNLGTVRVDNGQGMAIDGTIVNDGLILLNGTNSTTLLHVDGNTLLTGTGRVDSTDSPYGHIKGQAGCRLTNDTDHAIAGAGALCDNTIALTNLGVIQADKPNSALVVDPASAGDGDAPAINRGTMRATAGGTLKLVGGLFDNAGGIIEADACSWVEFGNSAVVEGGTFQGSGALYSSMYDNSAGRPIIADLTNNGLVRIPNGNGLTIRGTIVNNGTIALEASSTLTRLHVDGNTLLTGTGLVDLSNYHDNEVRGAYGDRLTNDTDHTIAGSGDLCKNTLALTNLGLIQADNPVALIIWPVLGNDGGAPAINRGTMRATAGGTLTLTGGLFDNAGGVIEADSNSTVNLSADAVIEGGTLQGGGAFYSSVADSSSSRPRLVDLTTNGLIRIPNQYGLGIGGTIVNNGTIVVEASSTLTRLNIDSNTLLTGTGRVEMWNYYDSVVRGTSTGRLTNDVDHTIAGSGNLCLDSLALTNLGRIEATQAVPLIVDPKADVDGNAPAVNRGLMRATTGGTLRLTDGLFDNDAGIIEADVNSAVNLSADAVIEGGTLQGSGAFYSNVADSSTSRPRLVDLTSSALVRIPNQYGLGIGGTIVNNGIITLEASTSRTRLNVDGNTLLTGTGRVEMANHPDSEILGVPGCRLTSDVDHTIIGSGQLCDNVLALTNLGTIDANQPTALTLDPVHAANDGNESLINLGVLRASGGLLLVTDGTVVQDGTAVATGGQTLRLASLVNLVNYSGTTLTGGTYIAEAGSWIDLDAAGSALVTNAADLTLDGAGSQITTTIGDTPLEDSLTNNAVGGALRVLGGRDYTAGPAAAFDNAGVLQLGGGTFDANHLTNAATGEVFGFGTIAPRIVNTGLVQAVGGVLIASGGIQGGSGTVQIDANASLDLSGAGESSSADYLIHNGDDLNLGTNDFVVSVDYTNANWGVGNTFSHRTNVTGTGELLADGDVAQSITGNVTGGASATATMDFGNVHVGEVHTLYYRVANDGTTGPALRGAIQTAANGGNITDPQLSGSGVTAGNYGPIDPGVETGDFAVFYTATTSGPLEAGQCVHVENNFDDVNTQDLDIFGTAFLLASPTDHTPEPVDFFNVHVGDLAEQALSITNDVPDDGFSEALDARMGATTGDAYAYGSFNLLAPQATDSTSLIVGMDTSQAGARTGTAIIELDSNGEGSSDLGVTPLPSQTVNIQVTVFRLANPTNHQPEPVQLGNCHVGDLCEAAVSITNYVPNDGFSEALDARMGATTGDAYAYGAFSLLAPQATDSTSLIVGMDTSQAGARTGTALIELDSNGEGSSGLGTTALAPQTVNVTAGVYRLANPTDHTPEPVQLGNYHVGDLAEGLLSLTNDAPADGYSEALDARTGAATGDAYAYGSFDLLTPGVTDSTSLVVGVDTASAGAKVGTAVIELDSNGEGSSGLGVTALAPQTVNVTADVYRLANPSAHTPEPVQLGNFHVGDLAEGLLSLTNDAPADGYSEALDARMGATTGDAYAHGEFNLLTPEATDATSLVVGVDTSTAGAKAGTAIIELDSNGEGSSGLGTTALAPQTVNVTGAVYRYAVSSGLEPNPVNLPNCHVGDVCEAALSVTNDAADDGYSEKLDVAIAWEGGDAYAMGSIDLLLPQATDDTSLVVGIDTSTAGAKGGTVIFDTASNGESCSGLGITPLGSEDVQVTGNVYRLAGAAITPDPVELANCHVGDVCEGPMTFLNDAADDGFSEALNAAIGGAAGDAYGTGSIALLPAQGIDDTSIAVGLDTSTAGAKAGTVTFGLDSDGTGTSDLGISALADVTVPVSGNVYRLAEALLNTPTPIDFGSFHVGQAIEQAISLTNDVPDDGFSEALDVAVGDATGDAYGSGSITALLPTEEDDFSITVGLDTSTAGPIAGAITLNPASNGTFSSLLPVTPLADITIPMSAGGYRLADAAVAPNEVDLGNVHVGDPAEDTLTVSNNAPDDGYSEGLDASVEGASGDAFGAGAINLLMPQQADAASIAVGMDTSTPGAKAGTVTIDLDSNGAGTSGLDVTPLQSQTVDITGAVYRLANPTDHTPEPVDLGIVHVGELAEMSLSLTNDVPADGYSEALSAVIGDATGDAYAVGSFSLLAPGATDSTSLIVGIDTSTAGAKCGLATIELTSDGAGSSELGMTALADQTVTVSAQVNNYAAVELTKLSGDGTCTPAGPETYEVDLGTVLVGDPNLLIELGVGNVADLPCDDLAGTWTLDAADFELTFVGFADLAGGQTLGGFLIELDSGTEGVFTGLITLHPQSTNADGYAGDLSDVTIALTGEVIPEPAALTLLTLGAVGFIFRRRRRR